MNLKHYQNEIIVGIAFLIMVFAYFYKEIHISHNVDEARSTQHKIEEINKVVSLKKLWDDPRISQKLDKLKQVVPAGKIKWNKKSKELNVVYSGITAEELNQVSKTVLNLGVQIKKFDLQKEGTSYKLELVCRW